MRATTARCADRPLPEFSRRPTALLAAIVLSLLLAPLLDPGRAAFARGCPGGSHPASSLLLPYFEVDLDAADGITTLFAIGNSSKQAPVLTHVVLWTDWGLPTYSFDLYLLPGDIQTMNLRDLFAGVIPVSGGPYLGCQQPVVNATLAAADLLRLRAQHTGQPVDSLCWGSGRRGPSLATGFVTVDTVRFCSNGEHRYPGDNNYFDPPPTGLAKPENTLFGDFFLVNPGENFAQGNELVHLASDQGFPTESAPATEDALFDSSTFYDWRYSTNSNRRPVAFRSRWRYALDGPFDGGAEAVMWFAPYGHLLSPRSCTSTIVTDPCQSVEFLIADEDAEVLGTVGRSGGMPFVTARVQLFDEELFGTAPGPYPTFGWVEVENLYTPACLGGGGGSGTISLQSHIIPLQSARNRFAVSWNATVLDNCAPSP